MGGTKREQKEEVVFIATTDRSIELDQKLAVAFRKRGAAKEELCMHHEAREDFHQALLLSNKELDEKQNDNWPFLVRGFIHISLKRYFSQL